MTGSLMQNLQIFTAFCGQKAMPNVVIVTTMWSDIKEEDGVRREAQLKGGYWQEMVVNGCKTERFENTYESAWSIINSVAGKDGISDEIVDNGRRVVNIRAKEEASESGEMQAVLNQLRVIFSR
jgi:hypothetical protein